jgi:hypothetical protein
VNLKNLWILKFNQYMKYISLRYFRASGSYQDFLDRGLLLLNQCFLVIMLKSPLQKVLRSPSWFSDPLRNICVTNDHGYISFVVYKFPSFFPPARLIARLCFLTKITRWLPHVEQELPIILEHSCKPPVFVGFIHVAQFLDFCLVIYGSLFFALSFFFLVIVLSVLLRFTTSDYPSVYSNFFPAKSCWSINRLVSDCLFSY